MAVLGVFPSVVTVREIRNSSPASSAGKFGIGESLVKTTEEPTA
jgi:hypothetical protein